MLKINARHRAATRERQGARYVAGEVISMHRTEPLYCLRDRGRIKSIGRFVTRIGEAIEVGQCNFDGDESGFRWTDAGWEAVFWRNNYYGLRGDASVITLMERSDGTQPYTEAEIDALLNRFFEQGRSVGPA